jgi:hypothetical protein
MILRESREAVKDIRRIIRVAKGEFIGGTDFSPSHPAISIAWTNRFATTLPRLPNIIRDSPGQSFHGGKAQSAAPKILAVPEMAEAILAKLPERSLITTGNGFILSSPAWLRNPLF